MQTTLSSANSPAVADTPFRLHVTPGETVAHPGWRRARADVLAAVARGEAVALLGPPGTGKTLLLRDLAQALGNEGWFVRLVERGDALVPDPVSGTDVLLVDEAGRMGADALARLCTTGAPFVLAALPDFAEQLAGLSSPAAHPVARPFTAVTLGPLPPEEVARFVAARLLAAGQPRNMLEADAVLALTRHSGGLPRLVTVLGGAALFLAELEHAPRVSRRHVDEAAAMRAGEGATEPVLPSPEPITAVPPRAEPLSAAPVLLPAWWRRRAVLGPPLGAAAVLGLVLAGGWALWGHQPVQAPGTRVNASSPVAGSRDEVGGPAPRMQPDDGRAGENPRDQAEHPALSEHQPASQRTVEVGRSLRANIPLRQRAAASGAFRGPVCNETLRQGGQMSLVITRQGAAGTVTARFQAWGGLLGSGELAGYLAEDGHLSVSGQLMVGKNPFTCDLHGIVIGDTLTGSASFVRSSSGRAAHSRFALSRS